MWRNLSLLFLSLSLLSFVTSGFLLWQRYYNPRRLSFSSIPPVRTSKLHGIPDRIIISSLNIDLPVVPAQINNGIWQTTPQGVSYLLTSASPGDIGNSVFYGHNWPNLLGRLKDIRPGDKIMVLSAGKITDYWVSRIRTVSPQDVGILNSGSHAQLTLYTCIGFADLKRLVVTAYTQVPK